MPEPSNLPFKRLPKKGYFIDFNPSNNSKFNSEDLIILEGKQHKNSAGIVKYEYPDENISINRFFFEQDWINQHVLSQKQNLAMLTIREFLDFLKLLKSEEKVYYSNGKKVPRLKVTQLYNTITTQKEPWRSEYLDADFRVINKILHINYEHRLNFKTGKLEPKYSQPLEECLMQNTPISLNLLLENANYQGLPAKNIKSRDLDYFAPLKDDNSVAWFSAGSDRVSLNCNWVPSDSNSSLGVRAKQVRP